MFRRCAIAARCAVPVVRSARARFAAAACLAVVAGLLGSGAHAAPPLGAKGEAEYPDFTRLTSLTTPDVNVTGLLALFTVTRTICLQTRTPDDLAALAPKGFTIARGDLHALGFEAPNWNGRWWAISVTGDSERDEAGRHPYWVVRFAGDGTPSECAMTFTPDSAGVDEATRQHMVTWLYVGAPQLFEAILINPPHAGTQWPLQPDVLELASACSPNWCAVTINPLMFGDDWRIALDMRLRPPPPQPQ